MVAVRARALTGALLAGGFIVAGIGAYYLLSQRETATRAALRPRRHDRRLLSSRCWPSFRPAIGTARTSREYQPVKLAAMEGLFRSTHGAPLAIIGMPDFDNRTLIDPIFVPDFLSFLAYGNLRRERQGPECLCARAVAAGRAHLLRLSRDGRTRHDLRRRDRHSGGAACSGADAYTERAGCSGC